MILMFQNNGLSIIFETLPCWLRWTMTIIFPFLRHINTWIMSKIVQRMMENDNEMATVTMNTSLLFYCGLYVAIIHSSANETTVYCILDVEMSFLIMKCYQIIGLQRKVMVNADEETNRIKKRSIISVLLSETIEVVTALSNAIG